MMFMQKLSFVAQLHQAWVESKDAEKWQILKKRAVYLSKVQSNQSWDRCTYIKRHIYDVESTFEQNFSVICALFEAVAFLNEVV